MWPTTKRESLPSWHLFISIWVLTKKSPIFPDAQRIWHRVSSTSVLSHCCGSSGASDGLEGRRRMNEPQDGCSYVLWMRLQSRLSPALFTGHHSDTSRLAQCPHWRCVIPGTEPVILFINYYLLHENTLFPKQETSHSCIYLANIYEFILGVRDFPRKWWYENEWDSQGPLESLGLLQRYTYTVYWKRYKSTGSKSQQTSLVPGGHRNHVLCGNTQGGG